MFDNIPVGSTIMACVGGSPHKYVRVEQTASHTAFGVISVTSASEPGLMYVFSGEIISVEDPPAPEGAPPEDDIRDANIALAFRDTPGEDEDSDELEFAIALFFIAARYGRELTFSYTSAGAPRASTHWVTPIAVKPGDSTFSYILADEDGQFKKFRTDSMDLMSLEIG